MSERRFLRLALIVAAAAAVSPFLYLPFMSTHTAPDSKEYVALGHSIDAGHYSSPIRSTEVRTSVGTEVDVTGISWPQSALGIEQRDVYRAPGYPLLLAAVGGGGPGTSRHLLYALQALLMGCTAFLLVLIARRLWGPTLALGAGALFAVDPYSKRYVTIVQTETLAGFLFVAGAYCVVRAWQSRATAWWAAAGLVAGGLTLVRPIFAIAIPLIAIACLTSSGAARRRALQAAVAVLAALLCIVPWAVRDHAVSGKLTVAAYGDGWNLLIAAYGEGYGRTLADVYADPSYTRDFTSVQRLAPTVAELRSNQDAYARYLARADAEQRSKAVHLYWRRLRGDPGGVLWETAYRAYFLWMAHTDWYQPTGWKGIPLRAVDWVLLLLAAWGGVVMLRRGGAGRLLAVFLLVYTAISAISHVEARYTVPLRGIFLAFALMGTVELARMRAVHRAT